ncbi:MAG TPA: hypothetical protein VJX66_21730, partial [Amycolatopsis sp.]|nr:hypothetical protein [Amycolatopsis sp.]
SRFPPVRPHLAPSPADTKHTEPLHRRENQPEAAQPPGNRRLPTWLFLAAGVLLVLTLIAGGTWWLGSGKSSESAPPGLSTTTLPSEPPAQALEPQLEDKVPQLPGTQFPQNSTLSLSKALELNLFAKETGQVFAQHGATRVVFRGSTAGDIGYLAFAVPTESDSDAKAVVDYLRDATRSGGFAPITGDPEVVTGRTGERRTDGTWYASGKVAVVLWASQQFDLEKAQLKDALDNTLASFRKALPPS